MTIRWFDNHCHIHGLDDAAPDVVAAARAEGVEGMITVGCTVADSLAAADCAAGIDGVWATAGVHPHDAKDGIDGLVDLLDRDEIVAVGECGLDYHYDHSPRDVQRRVFEAQIGLAHERQLPLVIHSRSAWDDTFDVLDDLGLPTNTVFHCFTGGPAEAEAALERGAYVSISGIVTFPSAGDLRAAAAIVPDDRLMIETDTPYLAPVPKRGKANRPANVPLIGEFLASEREISVESVATLTWDNAQRFYGV